MLSELQSVLNLVVYKLGLSPYDPIPYYNLNTLNRIKLNLRKLIGFFDTKQMIFKKFS